MNRRIMTVCTSVIFMTACANTNPVIDTKGVDMRAYQADLAECQEYAELISAGEEAAKEAGLGAAFFWALSKVSGGDDKASASVGAITGTSKGLREAAREKEQIVKNCLRGRGYRVLN